MVREAKTPTDFSWMYLAGNSCMAIRMANCTDVCWEVCKRHDLWISSTYAYMPRVKGYWIEERDKPVARLICIDKMVTVPYGNTIEDEHWLMRELKQAGKIDALPEIIRRPEFEDFEVPGLLYQNDFFCLVPKYDFRAQFMITFNPITKMFKWSQKWSEAPAYILQDGHIPNGAISAKEVQYASKLWR